MNHAQPNQHEVSRIWLNHAAATPLRPLVQQRILEYLASAAVDPEAAPCQPEVCRRLLAELLHAGEDEIALLPNTTGGIALVAGGLNWQAGDNAVLVAEQFPANSLPWLSLQQQGVEVRLVPTVDRRWTPQMLADRMDRRTRVVAVSTVAFDTGFRGDVAGLGRICRQHGALCVVDAIQSAGAIPHDVVAEQVDILAAGGYKWLMGPVGCGFAYVRRAVQDQLRPVSPGAWSTPADFNLERDSLRLFPDARRFEGGNQPWPLVYGWEAALQELLAAGPDAVWSRIQGLTERLVAGLETLGYTVMSPRDPGARSGIIAFTAGDRDTNVALRQHLYDHGIITVVRGDYLRVSPHFTNSIADMEALLNQLPTPGVHRA